jgi:hypothetical protein
MRQQLAYVRLGQWLEAQMRWLGVTNEDDEAKRHSARCRLAIDMALREQSLPKHQPRPWRRRLVAAER